MARRADLLFTAGSGDGYGANHLSWALPDLGGPQRCAARARPSRYGDYLRSHDERSGETVALKLIPISSTDPAAREQFEEEARVTAGIKHVNIAKVLDFRHEGEHFVYVSELLPGEPLASWVEQNGPMPADAVLRVAEQIVSVLSTARFHKLAHCAIQPSNLMIVPGSTPEGSWPFVKLMTSAWLNPIQRKRRARRKSFCGTAVRQP